MNYKQEKRIKDAAHMVRNVMSMSQNMQQINLNYASDLEQFIQKLKNIPTPGASAPVVNSEASKDSHGIMLSSNTNTAREESSEESPSTGTGEEAGKQTKKEGPKKTKRPPAPWVKGLYRKIMKKCHPDIISGDLPPEEQIYRAEALQIAIKSYKKEDFDALIYAGAIVGVFSERLSTNKQIAILNKSYSSNSQIISEIQSSISWCWGVNWDTFESRIQLIKRICLLNKIVMPSKEDLVLLLSDHEMK